MALPCERDTIRHGTPVTWYYEHKGRTPYGNFRDNMM